jgi:hypothetical protein
MKISIGTNHIDSLKRSQHILEWLQDERARVESEMVTIAQQWQREETKLRTFLAQTYNITGPFTLDADAGFIETPEKEPTDGDPQ